MPPQCCRCNGKGRCKGCVCARSGTVCTNCTPSHSGRCENYGKAARTDEDLVDSAGRPDVVSDQLERSNSQQTLTLTTGQEIYVENMENALLLDNQISNMEPVLPFRTTKHLPLTLPHRISNLLVIVAITPIHGHYQRVHNQIFNGDSLMDRPFAR